jgi:hypothetical protein
MAASGTKRRKPRRRVYVSFWGSSGSAWTDGLGCLQRECRVGPGNCTPSPSQIDPNVVRGWEEHVSLHCAGAPTRVGDSERQIDDLDPLVGVDDAFAPDGVEIGERLFRRPRKMWTTGTIHRGDKTHRPYAKCKSPGLFSGLFICHCSMESRWRE